MNGFYRFLFSIIIVVTVLFLSFSPPMKIATANLDIGNAKKVFTEGITNTENKNYEQAVENFTKAIELDYNFSSAYSQDLLSAAIYSAFLIINSDIYTTSSAFT